MFSEHLQLISIDFEQSLLMRSVRKGELHARSCARAQTAPQHDSRATVKLLAQYAEYNAFHAARPYNLLLPTIDIVGATVYKQILKGFVFIIGRL